MKHIRYVWPLIAVLSLASCGTTSQQLTKMMEEQKFLPYIPPQGNPVIYSGWNNYGPGVLLDPRNYNALRNAEENLGKKTVQSTRDAANDPAQQSLFGAFSKKRVSGNTFDGNGGWSFNEAAKIKAGLHLKNATTVDVKFGATYASEPFSYDGLQKKLRARHINLSNDQRNRLSSGRIQFVYKTIYSTSVTYYFNTTRDNGGDAALVIGPESNDALQGIKVSGSLTLTSDGGVTLNQPVIIGYVPVPRDSLSFVLP